MNLTSFAKSIEVPDYYFNEPSRWERFLNWLGLRQPKTDQPFIVEVSGQYVQIFRELANRGQASDFSFAVPAESGDGRWHVAWTGVVTSVKELDGTAKVEIVPVTHDT